MRRPSIALAAIAVTATLGLTACAGGGASDTAAGPGTAAADGRLVTRLARFEDATWPACDLVNASFSLPFGAPYRFEEVWRRIVDSLRPGGRFCGQLFGDRDEWAGAGIRLNAVSPGLVDTPLNDGKIDLFLSMAIWGTTTTVRLAG